MSTGINKNNDDILDVEKELFKGAERTAERYGVNADRIMAVYKRYPDLGITSPSLNITQLDQLINQFDQATFVLGPSKAFEVFENEDVQKLADRVFLVSYFNHYSDKLLCSLDELAHLTENFISFLLNNWKVLLQTGCPQESFLENFWLDWQLAKLYQFSFPIGMETPPIEDRARLNADRGKLFDLKVAVLRELLHAVSHQFPANLWEICLQLLTEGFSAEEVEFYLRMDHFYMGCDEYKGSPERIPGLDRPGGLTDLLEVIGHYEEELTLGVFSKTRKLLGELVISDVLKRPILLFSNYFQAVEHPLKGVLDSALDQFLSLEPKVIEFWENYRNRVNQALQNEFYVELTNGVKAKRKILLSYEPQTTFHSGQIRSHVEATGKFPPIISSSHVEYTEILEQYVFRQEGQIWTTTYNAITRRFRDAKGFHYIALLLRHPKDSIPLSQLLAAVGEQPVHFPSSIYSKMSPERLEELGLTLSALDEGFEIIDEDAETAYQCWLDKLHEKYEANINDPEKAAQIKEEINIIKKELSKAKGLGGRPRKFSTPKGKTLKAVSKAIFRTLGTIKKNHPDLYSHLNNALRPISPPFCYNPDRQINWITE